MEGGMAEAEAEMKRGTDGVPYGGMPKKKKARRLLLELSDADSSSSSSSSSSSASATTPSPNPTTWPSATTVDWEKFRDPEYLTPLQRFKRALHLQELRLYLISKGASDEIVNRIKQRTPEDAYAPHGEDVEKALDGFDQKDWYLHIYTPDCDFSPFVDDHPLPHKTHFTGDDLYPRLQFYDYVLPPFTTYESDQQCLSFLQELQQHLHHWISSQRPDSYLDDLWSDEGYTIADELVQNKYKLVGLDQVLRAVNDIDDLLRWDRISAEMENILLNMWIMVAEGEGEVDSDIAFMGSRSMGARKSDSSLQRVFKNPNLSGLLRETFDDVYDANTSCSEEEIMPLFHKAVQEGRDKLLSYYPCKIHRKIEIAKEIGII